jgi:Major royal jelly protein
MASLVLGGIGDNPDLEVVYQLSAGASDLTMAPDGTWIVGANQSAKPAQRAISIDKEGIVKAFPDEAMSTGSLQSPTPLDAVESLQTDGNGLVWLLDNGRRSEIPPKILGWNPTSKRVSLVLNLVPPAVVAGSFLSNFVIDSESALIVISDPANDSNAALILLDRASGIARRILTGHPSVIPDRSVRLPNTPMARSAKRLDGSALTPHLGVQALAMDRRAQWLYYAPVQSRQLYRIPMEILRNQDASPEALAKAVEVYATKPAAASISIDNKQHIYIGDLEGLAIGEIEPKNRSYKILSSDPRLLWPDGLSFGQDGKLYFFSRTQDVTAGQSGSDHCMFRIKAVAPGMPGQ